MDKEVLKNVCLQVIDDKLTKLQKAIDGYQKDLLSETKSSAGDKHETGRAMLQLEMEKLGQQYQTTLTQKQLLQKININSPRDKIGVGNLVKTSKGVYFMATGIGQIIFENQKLFVISINSPIGQQLLGKQVNDKVMFNGNSFMIETIS